MDRVLDVGCGPMFIAHSLIRKFNANYVGIDIMDSSELRKYAKIIEFSAEKKIDVVRASAEHLPFREKVFNVSLSLDVLEHLQKPQAAMYEMNRVTGGNLIISLPLENTFQKLTRFPILFTEGKLKDPTPEYHYIGFYKSYQDLWEKLLGKCCIKSEYVPFGMIRKERFNFYTINLCKTYNNEMSG